MKPTPAQSESAPGQGGGFGKTTASKLCCLMRTRVKGEVDPLLAGWVCVACGALALLVSGVTL